MSDGKNGEWQHGVKLSLDPLKDAALRARAEAVKALEETTRELERYRAAAERLRKSGG